MKRETTHTPLTRDPPGASPGHRLEPTMQPTPKQPETMPTPEDIIEAGERLAGMVERVWHKDWPDDLATTAEVRDLVEFAAGQAAEMVKHRAMCPELYLPASFRSPG